MSKTLSLVIHARIGTLPASYLIVKPDDRLPIVGDVLEVKREFSDEKPLRVRCCEIRDGWGDGPLYMLERA